VLGSVVRGRGLQRTEIRRRGRGLQGLGLLLVGRRAVLGFLLLALVFGLEFLVFGFGLGKGFLVGGGVCGEFLRFCFGLGGEPDVDVCLMSGGLGPGVQCGVLCPQLIGGRLVLVVRCSKA
jgi:hypothetical protein